MFYISERKAHMSCVIVFMIIIAIYMTFGNTININQPAYTMNDLAHQKEVRFIVDIHATNPQKLTDIYNVSSNGIVYNFSRYTHDNHIGWVILNSTDASVINYSSELMIYDVNVFEKVKKRMDE